MTSAGEDITQSGGMRNVSSGRGGSGKEFFDFKNIYITFFNLKLRKGITSGEDGGVYDPRVGHMSLEGEQECCIS